MGNVLYTGNDILEQSHFYNTKKYNLEGIMVDAKVLEIKGPNTLVVAFKLYDNYFNVDIKLKETELFYYHSSGRQIHTSREIEAVDKLKQLLIDKIIKVEFHKFYNKDTIEAIVYANNTKPEDWYTYKNSVNYLFTELEYLFPEEKW